MPRNDKDIIQEVNDKLYSPNTKDMPIEHKLSVHGTAPIEEDWQEGSFHDDDFGVSRSAATISAVTMKKTRSLAKVFLYGSVVFFVIAAGFGAWSIFHGSTISNKNVSVSIEGSGTTGGGEALSFDVVIANKNAADIESAELIMNLPDGVSDAGDPTKAGITARRTIKGISAGQSGRERFSVVAFGSEGEQKKISFTLQFRFKGQSATWESKAEYPFTVTSSPVNVTVESTQEVNAGQEFDLTVKIASNTNKELSGLLLKAEYPRGFKFHTSAPAPAYGQTMWNIGDLKPGESTEVRIRGTIAGDEGQEEIFSVALGQKSRDDDRTIGTTYNAITQTVVVKKPFISVDMAIDDDHGSVHTTESGKTMRATLNWRSTISSKIIDAEIDIKIHGPALDRYSVSTGGKGFYRSIDDTIVWTKGDTPDLGVIDPGGNGMVSFSFLTLPLSGDAGKLLKNPTVTLEVSVSGRRLSDTNVPESVSTFLTRTVNVNSNFKLTSRAVYYGGTPFVNTGPMPPRAEKETMYTVVWTVINSANDISGATVKTSLPVYARFVGTVSPTGEKVANPIGQDIVWGMGDIKAGAGVTSPPHEVAFQIAITPSIAQIGRTINLTDDVALSGTDTFTSKLLSDIKAPLTTRITTDPQFKTENAFVAQ